LHWFTAYECGVENIVSQMTKSIAKLAPKRPCTRPLLQGRETIALFIILLMSIVVAMTIVLTITITTIKFFVVIIVALATTKTTLVTVIIKAIVKRTRRLMMCNKG